MTREQLISEAYRAWRQGSEADRQAGLRFLLNEGLLSADTLFNLLADFVFGVKDVDDVEPTKLAFARVLDRSPTADFSQVGAWVRRFRTLHQVIGRTALTVTLSEPNGRVNESWQGDANPAAWADPVYRRTDPTAPAGTTITMTWGEFTKTCCPATRTPLRAPDVIPDSFVETLKTFQVTPSSVFGTRANPLWSSPPLPPTIGSISMSRKKALEYADGGFVEMVTKWGLSGRYTSAEGAGDWCGWIEDNNRKWIAFVAIDGSVMAWDERDAASGGVVGLPYRIHRPDLAVVTTDGAGRIGAQPAGPEVGTAAGSLRADADVAPESDDLAPDSRREREPSSEP